MPHSLPDVLPQCPVCKKADPLAQETSTCPRCGCDLTKTASAHASSREHLIAAATCLRTGQYEDALDYAAYAWTLARLPAIPPLACLAALHSRRLPDLALWRTRERCCRR